MGRAPCCDKDGLKKGPWLPEEDQKLVDYIHKHGPGNWRALPKKAGLHRCGKSCRLRWTNYLRPDIKRGRFTFEEEEAIIQLHSVLGNKWSAIAAKLPGRTDNEIKNYWNTHIRKRLLRSGIDPVTHTRQFDLLNNLPSIFNSPLAHNTSHQLNLLNLLSLQSLVNPDLLRLAALLSPCQNPNPSQNQNQNQNQIQNQNLNFDSQLMQPGLDGLNFGPETFSLVNDQWQSNVLVNQQCDSAQQQQQQQHEGQYVPNYQLNTDNFLLDVPDLSTEETPLNSNSNSEFPNSSNISSSEDEIDSYCRNLMNFDLPDDFFNVC